MFWVWLRTRFVCLRTCFVCLSIETAGWRLSPLDANLTATSRRLKTLYISGTWNIASPFFLVLPNQTEYTQHVQCTPLIAHHLEPLLLLQETQCLIHWERRQCSGVATTCTCSGSTRCWSLTSKCHAYPGFRFWSYLYPLSFLFSL